MDLTVSELAEQLKTLEMRETIYMIESPSAEDLYHGRNEGDALARTLSLAEIEVVYYIATSDEMFDLAMTDIAIRINSIGVKIQKPAPMPFIHISAHADGDGILLTDGDIILWEKLTRRLREIHEIVGGLELPRPFPKNLPRINLSLSSCSAYRNYTQHLKPNQPFQFMLGPTRDVGWCQALIGFVTFFYQNFILRSSFHDAVAAMNAAAAGPEGVLFALHAEHDIVGMTREVHARLTS